MADTDKTIDGYVALLALALSVARSFFDAWVLLLLWRWFVAPLGVIQIGYWHAYGIDSLIGLYVALVVASGRVGREQPTGAQLLGGVFGNGATYAVALGVGWLVHLGMVS